MPSCGASPQATHLSRIKLSNALTQHAAFTFLQLDSDQAAGFASFLAQRPSLLIWQQPPGHPPDRRRAAKNRARAGAIMARSQRRSAPASDTSEGGMRRGA